MSGVCATEAPERNSPRIGRFLIIVTNNISEPMYLANSFVLNKKCIFVRVPSFSMAIFIWFSPRYVFNNFEHCYKVIVIIKI